MPANPDFKDLFRLFSEEGVEYLVIGAHAVIFYAEPRYTKDLDLWVNPTSANAAKVWTVLSRFGAPLTGVSEEDFANADIVYQVGMEPNRIDILMAIEGVAFDRAWERRVDSTYEGVPIHIIGKEDLMEAKRVAGRPQDLLDLERLNRAL